MLSIIEVLKSKYTLISRVKHLSSQLEKEKEKADLFKRQLQGRDEWGHGACVLIRNQLHCIQSGENIHLGSGAVQAQKDIASGFLVDRITMLIEADFIEWPHLPKLNNKEILALATKIVDRTNSSHL